MSRNYFVYLTVILAGLLLGAQMACTFADTARDPARPEGVPKEALWVGGPDGGAFVLVKPEAANRYAVRVFHQSGDPWFEGRMALDREPEKPFSLTDVNSYSAWDGERLHLADGRSLVRTP